jgi:hypothetical protein
VLRVLVSSLILVAVALAWVWLVTAAGIWWMSKNPPPLVPGTDTYFMAGNWVYRLAVIVPLVLFSAWYWRRIFSRAT